jgi:hypothetical protein
MLSAGISASEDKHSRHFRERFFGLFDELAAAFPSRNSGKRSVSLESPLPFFLEEYVRILA